MSSIERIDLRKLKSKESLLRGNNLSLVTQELRSYGVNVSEVDVFERKITLQGLTRIELRGREIVRPAEETWDVKEYLKLARVYKKNYNRINKIREEEGLDSYYQRPLEELVLRDSSRYVGKGLKNAIATQKKILKTYDIVKDKVTGEVKKVRRKSKLRSAVENIRELRKLKTESFDNPDQYFSEEQLAKYKTKSGRFRSKKAEREYYKQFSEMVTEQFEAYEGEFFGWLSMELDTSEKTVKEQYASFSYEDRKQLYREFVEYKLKAIIEAEGSIEGELLNEELDMDFIRETYKKIRKEDGRK